MKKLIIISALILSITCLPDANAQGRDAHGRPCEADIYFGGCKGEAVAAHDRSRKKSSEFCRVVQGKSVRYGWCNAMCKGVYPCRIDGKSYVPLKTR
jgi:hypothetical protein